MTGDGVGDIIIGSPANDVPSQCGLPTSPPGCRKNEGESFIFDGATRALVHTYRVPQADPQPPECSTTMPAAVARCGNLSVSQSPGDIDRDGVPDQLVAAYSLKRPFTNPEFFGRVYLFSGKTGALLARIDQPGTRFKRLLGAHRLGPEHAG